MSVDFCNNPFIIKAFYRNRLACASPAKLEVGMTALPELQEVDPQYVYFPNYDCIMIVLGPGPFTVGQLYAANRALRKVPFVQSCTLKLTPEHFGFEVVYWPRRGIDGPSLINERRRTLTELVSPKYASEEEAKEAMLAATK